MSIEVGSRGHVVVQAASKSVPRPVVKVLLQVDGIERLTPVAIKVRHGFHVVYAPTVTVVAIPKFEP